MEIIAPSCQRSQRLYRYPRSEQRVVHFRISRSEWSEASLRQPVARRPILPQGVGLQIFIECSAFIE